MPTYDYYCQTCDSQIEVFQSMKEAPLTRCTCEKKGKVKRLIGTGSGLIFKGSGFYETDYKRTGQKKSGDADSTGAKPAETAAKPDKPKVETSAKADAG